MKKIKLTYVLVTILAFSSCKKMKNEVPIEEQEMIVSAFVGAGGPSYVDGVGEGAAFNRPLSLATDPSGNIFVADNKNLRIRKVSPEGVVSTFAGSGIEGYVDGPGTTAQFSYDGQIVSDAQGNLFLTDPRNSCIRKISPTGVFSTIVGAPGETYTDGPIELNSLADIAVDASNNIYFLDRKGVRKISANGTVSTVVQDRSSNILGPIATASIPNPKNICTDKAGNIYVSSFYQANSLIFKISTNGIVSLYAGAMGGDEGYQVGLAQVARFRTTRGMVSDKSNNIFVLDNNHVITKITPDGYVRLVAGTPYKGVAQPFVPGPAFKAVFFDNTDIAVAPDGTLYALEDLGSSIRKISLVDKASTPLSQEEIEKVNWNKPTGWK